MHYPIPKVFSILYAQGCKIICILASPYSKIRSEEMKASSFLTTIFSSFHFRFDLKRKEHDDITERLRLRRKLGCKDFKWYLNNIYPELEIPDDNYLATGEVSIKLSGNFHQAKF